LIEARSRHSRLWNSSWFSLLCIVFSCVTGIWLYLDHVPPAWDDAWYLTNSLVLYDALEHGGIAEYASRFQATFGFKAPLIAALPTPFYLFFGRNWHSAFLVNIATMPILFAAMYLLASRWWSTRAGLLSIALVGTMPLMYGLARWYMVEYVLTAAIAAAVWLLIESKQLERTGFVLLFGVVCGLGLLLKIIFGILILPPFVFAWIRARRRVWALLLAASPCLAVAAPWYVPNIIPTIKFAIVSSWGESAAVYGTGAVFSFSAIATYLLRVAREGLSVYYAALSVLLGAWVGRDFLRKFLRNDSAIILWWMLPFAIFLFGSNKDVRFVAPMLPAAALLVAGMLDFAIPRGHVGSGIACVILAFPFLQMFAISFGTPYAANGTAYARPFSRTSWRHDEILNAILAHSTHKPDEKQLLVMGTDRARFNANNMELAAVGAKLPINVETTAHEKDWNTLQLRLNQASFFVYNDGGEAESPAFNPYFQDLVRRVHEDSHFREVFPGFQLPDGGTARIFQNKHAVRRSRLIGSRFLRAGTEQSGALEVNLGGIIALTGFSGERTSDSVRVRLSWRSLKRADRDYWCFTHVLDPKDKIVAQLDHPLLDDDPPLCTWQPGDGADEEMRIPIAAEFQTQSLRLRLGIYDPKSGVRLRIAAPQGVAVSEFALTDDATALLTRR